MYGTITKNVARIGQRWFRLERSWEGRDPKAPIIKMMPCTGTDVHRFKLDEENRLVVTTHRNGGLRVSCMDQGVLLFEMSRVRGSSDFYKVSLRRYMRNTFKRTSREKLLFLT